jgi:O-antigen ligase
MKDIVNSYANNMVVMMEASLPILFYRIKYKSSKFVFAAFFMSLFNIIVSESRGGLVTLSLFFLLLPLYYYRRKFNKVLLLSIIVFSILFVIGGILFSNAFENFEVLQRFSEIKSIGNLANSRDTSELSARLMMYYHGFVLILSNPILGIGWGSFISSMEDFYGYGVIAHNLIIEIWTSCGIIGVIIFTLTFFTAFKRLYKHYRFNLLIDTNISYWCMANIVCLILLCFHGLFRPFLTNILLYLPLAEAFIFTRYKSVQQTT